MSSNRSILEYLGSQAQEHIERLLKKNWISQLFKIQFVDLKGSYKLNEIQFKYYQQKD